MLFINNNDVMKVLDMRLTLEALDEGFRELVKGDATGMGRIDLYVPKLVMPPSMDRSRAAVRGPVSGPSNQGA